MFDDGMGVDWAITLLCSVTDRSAARSSSDDVVVGGRTLPRGVGLHALSSMAGLQKLFLGTTNAPRRSLADESEELLQFISVLNRRRGKSKMDALSSLSGLEQKLDEKRGALSELRKVGRSLGRHVDALNRMAKYVDGLILLSDYAEALRMALADGVSCPEERDKEAATTPVAEASGRRPERLSSMKRQLLSLWRDMGQWDRRDFGTLQGDLLLDSLRCFERAMRGWEEGRQRSFAAVAGNLAARLSTERDESIYGVEASWTLLGIAMDLFGYVDALRLLCDYEESCTRRFSGMAVEQASIDDSITMVSHSLRSIWDAGHLECGRRKKCEEYIELLRGEADACRIELMRISEDIRSSITALEERTAELQRGEYELRRTIDGISAEIGQCSNYVVLTTTLTPVGDDFVGNPVRLVFDEASSAFRPESDVYGREPRALREWVSLLEGLPGTRDVYIYLEYTVDGGSAYRLGGQEAHLGLWGDDTYESWFVPADLLRLPEILQSTDNPVDYIYPVREYGAPYESFGSRRRGPFEEFIAMVDGARESGSAIYIPYRKGVEQYGCAGDTLSLCIDEDCRVVVNLRGGGLDSYDPIFPLRRYPINGDGEVPLLGVDLEGSVWLVDLGSARIDLDSRNTRGAKLFNGGKEFAHTVPESLVASIEHLDCWGVASNIGLESQNRHAARRGCSERCPENTMSAPKMVYRLEKGEAIRLRFFEIVRRNGSYGYVLAKARYVLLKHGWEPDEEATVLDDIGHIVEAVWQTPQVEGLTILGIQNLKQFVLSFGSDVVVESPAWLRAWHIGLARSEAEKLQLDLDICSAE